eukprot:4300411-Pyramimonas_sp.AAC.2
MPDAGDRGPRAHPLTQHVLPRPQAGEPAHRRGRVPEASGLWLLQKASQRHHLHALRHGGLPRAGDHHAQGARPGCGP